MKFSKMNCNLALFLVIFLFSCVPQHSNGVNVGMLKLDEKKLPRMIDVPGGSFRMGTDIYDENKPWLEDAVPSRNVKLSSYQVSETLVSYGLYQDFLRDSGYKPTDMIHPEDGPLEDNIQGNDSPVFFVNWYESILFCNWLSIKKGFTPVYEVRGKVSRSKDIHVSVMWNREANGYRLLTHAEYEYLLRDFGKKDNYLDQLYKWKSQGLKENGAKIGSVLNGSMNSIGVIFLPGMSEWTWSKYGKYSGNDLIDPESPDKELDIKEIRMAPGYIYESYFYSGASIPYGYGYYIGIRLAQNSLR